MRTDDEIIKAVHDRAMEMKQTQRKRQTILMGGIAFVCALVLVVLLASVMPSLQRQWSVDDSAALQASMFAASGVLSYVVVGIIAFLLGIMVTVFCVLLRRWRDGEEKSHDRDR